MTYPYVPTRSPTASESSRQMTPVVFAYKSGPTFLSVKHQLQHRPATPSTHYPPQPPQPPQPIKPTLFTHNVQIDLHRLHRPRPLLHAGRTRSAPGTRPDAHALTRRVRRHVRQPVLLAQQRRVLERGQRPRRQIPDVRQHPQLPIRRRRIRRRVELSPLRRVLEHHQPGERRVDLSDRGRLCRPRFQLGNGGVQRFERRCKEHDRRGRHQSCTLFL